MCEGRVWVEQFMVAVLLIVIVVVNHLASREVTEHCQASWWYRNRSFSTDQPSGLKNWDLPCCCWHDEERWSWDWDQSATNAKTFRHHWAALQAQIIWTHVTQRQDESELHVHHIAWYKAVEQLKGPMTVTNLEVQFETTSELLLSCWRLHVGNTYSRQSWHNSMRLRSQVHQISQLSRAPGGSAVLHVLLTYVENLDPWRSSNQQ